MTETIAVDAGRQKQAKEYARLRRRLWLAGMLLGALYALVWLVSGASRALAAGLTGLLPDSWLVVAAFGLVLGGAYFLLRLPLGYYAGFVLPHRFGLSNQTFRGWLADQGRGLLIGLPTGLALLEGLYALLRAFPDTWWLWAALGMFVFNVLAANLSPILIMPLFNKFTPLGREHADLERRLLDLAARARTRVRGVFKFDMSRRTKAANAALTGLGHTRRIVVGDTLLSEFTPDEVETVLAHELGHHVHRDLLWLILVEGLWTFLGLFLASRVMALGRPWFGIPVESVASLPLFLLVVGAYNLIRMPLTNAFSRWRERLADSYALEMTGKKAAFASALIRLANQNLGEVDPEAWVVWLFYDHPPLGERIAMARNWPVERA
ncbi:MAG: M48 family metallopeptidase [Chloroflexia bacterium]